MSPRHCWTLWPLPGPTGAGSSGPQEVRKRRWPEPQRAGPTPPLPPEGRGRCMSRVQPRGPGGPDGGRGLGSGMLGASGGGSRGLTIPGGLRVEAPAKHMQVSGRHVRRWNLPPAFRAASSPTTSVGLMAAVAALLLPRLRRWGCEPVQQTPPRTGPRAALSRPAASCPSPKRQILKLPVNCVTMGCPRQGPRRSSLSRTCPPAEASRRGPPCAITRAGPSPGLHGQPGPGRASALSQCEPAGSRPGKTSGCSASPTAGKDQSPSSDGQLGEVLLPAQRLTGQGPRPGAGGLLSCPLTQMLLSPHLRHFWPSVWASQVAPAVKNLPANAGHVRTSGSIPGSGRSPGGANGSPLQYSCLENPVDRGACRATVPGAAESRTRLSDRAAHRP